MCYTPEDSLVAYGINTIFCVILWFVTKTADYKVIAAFLFFVGQMQLFDYLFWEQPACTTGNWLTTKLAILFNHAQPLVLGGLLVAFGLPLSAAAAASLALYTLLAIPYTWTQLRDVNCTQPKGGIMVWEWNHGQYNMPVYAAHLATLALAGFSFRDAVVRQVAPIVALLTFFVASKIPRLNISKGRIWCYIASFTALPFLVLNDRK